MSHLKDTGVNDAFTEMPSKTVDENKVGRILNHYYIIANLDTQLKIFRFIVVDTEVERLWMWFYGSGINWLEVIVCSWIN